MANDDSPHSTFEPVAGMMTQVGSLFEFRFILPLKVDGKTRHVRVYGVDDITRVEFHDEVEPQVVFGDSKP